VLKDMHEAGDGNLTCCLSQLLRYGSTPLRLKP